MSTPGGPYWQEQPPQYQVDPITGQPSPFQGQPQPQQQQQFGGYQGFGMYQPPEPPKSNSAPWIIALVALLVLGGGGVGAYFLLSGDDKPEQQPIAGPSSSSAAPTTTKGKPSPVKTTAKKPTTAKTPTEVEEIKVDAVTPGFQGVLSYKEKVAYDIPTDWKIETPGMVVGFEDNAGKPKAIMHGVSTYRENACTNVRGSYRGHVGLVSVDNLELPLGAKNGVKVFAEAAALNKDNSMAPVTYTEPVATKVGQGKIDAMMAKATLTVNQPGECSSPTVEFTSVAFKIGGGKTAIFISYMDQGVPDALPAATLDKVIASLRIYED